MKNNLKLELTWIGKYDDVSPEPRILIENKELSNISKDKNTENMLIHGDNLLALKALEQDFAGKIKCIYIDPPYNTGSAFEYYEDNLEHSIWLSLMKPRLNILRNLLRDDGIIFIQIDDNEQAYLKVLCDEVFGRNNYLNTISVKMKNIAGASGGGEDKRLKKNVEYILVYTKKYDEFKWINNAYDYIEISDFIQNYIDEGKSWKYTSVLINEGDKEFIGSTVDGEGSEIKVFKRKNYIIRSIKQVAKDNGISEKEAYYRFGDKIFRTTNAQSSIRTRIIDFRNNNSISDELLSIEYIPRTGKFKGKVYEQFYKDDICNLFVWLKDTAEFIDNKLYKKELQGTYWSGIHLNNLTKEGSVNFPSGKKPEALIQRIIDMSTVEGDYVLDSFLGSGTTSAVAHKMNRKWIGIEMGEHAYTHCKGRLDRVINGLDNGGITEDVSWKGGGGYKFYELAPSLLKKDRFGCDVINSDYSPEMLAASVCKYEGFTYNPDPVVYWKQASYDNSFLYVTTQHLTANIIESIHNEMKEDEYLLIVAKSFEDGVQKIYKNINIKKIPQYLLGKCEFGKDNYNLNIVSIPEEDDLDE